MSDKINELKEKFNEAIAEYEQAIVTKMHPSHKTWIFSKIKKLHDEIKELEKLKDPGD